MTRSTFFLFVLNYSDDPESIFYEGLSRKGKFIWRFVDKSEEMEEKMDNLEHFFKHVSPESPAVIGLETVVGVRV